MVKHVRLTYVYWLEQVTWLYPALGSIGEPWLCSGKKCLFVGKLQIWAVTKELIWPTIFVLTKQIRKMQTLRTPAAKFWLNPYSDGIDIWNKIQANFSLITGFFPLFQQMVYNEYYSHFCSNQPWYPKQRIITSAGNWAAGQLKA